MCACASPPSMPNAFRSGIGALPLPFAGTGFGARATTGGVGRRAWAAAAGGVGFSVRRAGVAARAGFGFSLLVAVCLLGCCFVCAALFMGCSPPSASPCRQAASDAGWCKVRAPAARTSFAAVAHGRERQLRDAGARLRTQPPSGAIADTTATAIAKASNAPRAHLPRRSTRSKEGGELIAPADGRWQGKSIWLAVILLTKSQDEAI